MLGVLRMVQDLS